MMKKNDAKQLVEQGLKHEFASVEEFVRAMACYGTLENMGQDAADIVTRSYSVKPHNVFNIAYSTFSGDAEIEGVDLADEYKDWELSARELAVTLQEKGLPLTVENGNHAYNETGPFASP